MVDWPAHYDGIYGALGVEASIATADSDGVTADLTVIDKTAGEVFGDGATVESIKPACDVRAAELTLRTIELSQLNNARITFNEKTWTVTHHRLKPSPAGEGKGEVRLFLGE